jgi:hypothetical protein
VWLTPHCVGTVVTCHRPTGPHFIALLLRVRIILPRRVGFGPFGRTPIFGTLSRSHARIQLSQDQCRWGMFTTRHALSTDATISPRLPLQVVSQSNISQSEFLKIALFKFSQANDESKYCAHSVVMLRDLRAIQRCAGLVMKAIPHGERSIRTKSFP